MDAFGAHYTKGKEVYWIVRPRAVQQVIDLADDIVVAGLCTNLFQSKPYDSPFMNQEKQVDPITSLNWDKKIWLTYDPSILLKRVASRPNQFGRTKEQQDEITYCLEHVKPSDFEIIDTTEMTPAEVAKEVERLINGEAADSGTEVVPPEQPAVEAEQPAGQPVS
jgi:hypothetical protein